MTFHIITDRNDTIARLEIRTIKVGVDIRNLKVKLNAQHGNRIKGDGTLIVLKYEYFPLFYDY